MEPCVCRSRSYDVDALTLKWVGGKGGAAKNIDFL